MAREKKNEELSLEEKLEQALVPVEEQPYEVPGNWCWTTIESISDIVSKGTTPKGGKSSYIEDGIRFLRVENFLDDGTISHEGMMHIAEDIHFGFLKRSILKKDDILISIAGTLGKTAIVQEDNLPINTNQAVAFIRLNSKAKILPKYLRFSLINPVIQNYLLEKTKVTSIPNLTLEIISTCPIPLPPKEEQQRIIERIGSLFAKLDEVKEKAQAVVDGFEIRKSAILYKAFTGKLTERWRKEHGLELDSWENRTLASVCSSIFDGDHMPPPKSEEGVPFLVISNVNNGHLSFENTRFVPQEYYDSLSETRKPQMGDILYTLVGSFGIPVVVDDERSFCFQRHMALLKPNGVNTYFLWYLLQSQEMFNKVSEIATGTAQLTVPIKGLRMIEFQKPTESEQSEIVQILDNILEKEQQAKEIAESVPVQIDIMKKTILVRAFRGKLGTNDPAEESAVEMLKKILEWGDNYKENKIYEENKKR